jgi:hypothetical protein
MWQTRLMNPTGLVTDQDAHELLKTSAFALVGKDARRRFRRFLESRSTPGGWFCLDGLVSHRGRVEARVCKCVENGRATCLRVSRDEDGRFTYEQVAF